ncbi:MAG: site-specific DNA-methyltransferase [Gammaproteobacteria bacterium]|nr:site-specific DNA-methyltransferase [Gammaproteobacteria bacterium]
MAKKTKAPLSVETIVHDDARRKNIPTAEYQSVMEKELQSPIRVAYKRRNRDLDPQLVWRGKDEQDWSDLVVNAPPLYIQDKVHPKVLIDDLKRQTQKAEEQDSGQADLFADFNGAPSEEAKTEFYQHDQNWSNRMILGDSLQVMASLAEREGLQGKVQCIYFDPPYGIKFNSNFQWSTTSRDVKDGKADHITREPEQVKAFRDTWRDGIHSYLTYLRDRLIVARDLLTESGSIFVQIGDENLHRVRALLDEVFGENNFVSIIQVQKTGSQAASLLANTVDFLVWFAKSKDKIKYRQLYNERVAGHVSSDRYDQIELNDGSERWLKKEELDRSIALPEGKVFQHTSLISSGQSAMEQVFDFHGRDYRCGSSNHWKTTLNGLTRLALAERVASGRATVRYKRYLDDFSVLPISDRWESLQIGTGLIYVVQTAPSVVQRCILMATDPGDLVLDPTCGSGTTAYVAEQWGRRWITIDTSRVSLALARARIMGARYPYYLLADTPEGQQKEAEIARAAPSSSLTYGRISQGFVYQRVPHITLKSIANNAEIDVIWERFQPELEALREKLNRRLGTDFEEWKVPRAPGNPWPEAQVKLHATILSADSDKKKQTALKKLNTALKRHYSLQDLPESPCDYWDDDKGIEIHKQWWALRIARQREIDASIAAKAGQEYLYDKPYEDKKKVRVAGPFTVESLSPHRALGLDENDELIDPMADRGDEFADTQDFTHIILENLKIAGVQQAHKTDKINFTAIKPWPGYFICAEGRYMEGGEASGVERRAAIFIGPEFGTVSRPDLVTAAREAGDADFDMLIACAFNYEAHATEFNKLGRIPVLKARMNADLHMAEDLKNTDKANLFVIFGEPDIDIIETDDKRIQVKVNGVDVFHPNTGEVRSDNADGIACWFVDTDYNEESFFVRQAYFLGANDPYKALKNTLKAEINEEAWQSLYSDTSRPFDRPTSGRIAVKVINHLGDEVMKVFGV